MLSRIFHSWSVGISKPEGIVRGQSFEEINPCFGLSQSLYVKQHRQFVAHGLCVWAVFPFPPFSGHECKDQMQIWVFTGKKKKLSSQNLGKLQRGLENYWLDQYNSGLLDKYTQQRSISNLFSSADPRVELPWMELMPSGRKIFYSRLGFSRVWCFRGELQDKGMEGVEGTMVWSPSGAF